MVNNGSKEIFTSSLKLGGDHLLAPIVYLWRKQAMSRCVHTDSSQCHCDCKWILTPFMCGMSWKGALCAGARGVDWGQGASWRTQCESGQRERCLRWETQGVTPPVCTRSHLTAPAGVQLQTRHEQNYLQDSASPQVFTNEKKHPVVDLGFVSFGLSWKPVAPVTVAQLTSLSCFL